MSQCLLIDGFQKPRTERPVNRYGAPDNPLSQRLFFHRNSSLPEFSILNILLILSKKALPSTMRKLERSNRFLDRMAG